MSLTMIISSITTTGCVHREKTRGGGGVYGSRSYYCYYSCYFSFITIAIFVVMTRIIALIIVLVNILPINTILSVMVTIIFYTLVRLRVLFLHYYYH